MIAPVNLSVGNGRWDSHSNIHLYAGSCFDISTSTRRRRFMSPPVLMAPFRANAAAAPREARPMPPAKRGLLKRASRLRTEEIVGTGGSDIASW